MIPVEDVSTMDEHPVLLERRFFFSAAEGYSSDVSVLCRPIVKKPSYGWRDHEDPGAGMLDAHRVDEAVCSGQDAQVVRGFGGELLPADSLDRIIRIGDPDAFQTFAVAHLDADYACLFGGIGVYSRFRITLSGVFFGFAVGGALVAPGGALRGRKSHFGIFELGAGPGRENGYGKGPYRGIAVEEGKKACLQVFRGDVFRFGSILPIRLP